MKKLILLVLLIGLSVPALVQAQGNKLVSYATYESPEGIVFESFSSTWDGQKLQALYHELLQNAHGKELGDLTKIEIRDNAKHNTLGEYYSVEKRIVLYNGRKYKTVEDVRNTLAHEYGHHIQYTYFPGIEKDPHSTWSKLRGLTDFPAVKQDKGDHKWKLGEIFADDYALLYGHKAKMSERLNRMDPISNIDLITHRSTFSENQDIPNVMENQAVQDYLEQTLHFKINKENLQKKPTVLGIHPLYRTQPDRLYLFLNLKNDPYVDVYRELKVYDLDENDTYIPGYHGYNSVYLSHPDTHQVMDNMNSLLLSYASREDGKSIFKITYTAIDSRTGNSIDSETVFIKIKGRGQMYMMNKEDLEYIKK